MKNIFAAFKRYNANTKNMNKNDCTVRAMSLAFGEPYETIYKELKDNQSLTGTRIYNNSRNVISYINKRKLRRCVTNCVDNNTNIRYDSVEEFTQAYPTGTYLVLTNDSPTKRPNHIIAIIDGDIYDSWDSSTQSIIDAYVVSEEASQLYTDTYTIEEAAADIDVLLEAYIHAQNQKYTFMYVSMSEVSVEDSTTIRFSLVCRLDDNVPAYSKYRKNAVIRQNFIGKFDIKKTQQENVDSIIPKLKTKMYDWMYNIRTELQNAMKADSMSLHPQFDGDKTLVARLPEWCWPHIRRADSDGYWHKYELILDAMDGDPRKVSEPSVFIEADSLTELKRNLNHYKDGFQRAGIDY